MYPHSSVVCKLLKNGLPQQQEVRIIQSKTGWSSILFKQSEKIFLDLQPKVAFGHSRRFFPGFLQGINLLITNGLPPDQPTVPVMIPHTKFFYPRVTCFSLNFLVLSIFQQKNFHR